MSYKLEPVISKFASRFASAAAKKRLEQTHKVRAPERPEGRAEKQLRGQLSSEWMCEALRAKNHRLRGMGSRDVETSLSGARVTMAVDCKETFVSLTNPSPWGSNRSNQAAARMRSAP